VDLMIGGISERIVNGTVGPTFGCILCKVKLGIKGIFIEDFSIIILAEQFSKIHQRHQQRMLSSHDSLLDAYRSINGSKLLCLNLNMVAVPENIFRLQDNR